MLKRFNSSLQDYKELLATAQMQKVDMEDAVKSGKHVYSYTHNKAKYLGDNMKRCVADLRKLITDLYSSSTNPVLGEQYSKIMVNVRLLEEKYYDPNRSLPIVEKIEKMIKPLEQDEFIRKELEEFNVTEPGSVPEENEEIKEEVKEEEIVGEKEPTPESLLDSKPEKKSMFEFRSKSAPKTEQTSRVVETPLEVTDIPEIRLPFLPVEIASYIVEDVNELERCYNNSCYRSAVILCGRILETALHRRYFEVTGKDVLETNPGIGLGKLIAKLNEHEVSVDPGLMTQVHLVNNVRISSVHVKKNTFRPNQNQTQAIILYTLDVLHKMFSK